MKKVSLFLIVAALAVGAAYAAYAYSGNDGAADLNATAAHCPKSADCPRDCEGRPGKCTDCPDFADKDGDGKCDRMQACRSGDRERNCPGHADGGCRGHKK